MVSLSSSKRRAPPPRIDIRVPRDGDNDNDDNDKGGRQTPTRTLTPLAITTVHPTISSPIQGTTLVSDAASRTTPVGRASTLPLVTTVTAPAPAQTTTVTMFVTVSANPVTVTVTATPASAIPTTKTSAPTTNGRDDTQAPELNTTRASGGSAVMITNSAQMSSAVISRPGAALIGGLGVAAGLSVIGVVVIFILRRKKQTKEQRGI